MSIYAYRLVSALVVLGICQTAFAQQQPDPAKLIASQQQAMQKLAFMDGVWRGPAASTRPTGEKDLITQTERIGPFLDGSVKVIEGRGYHADGRLAFNSFGTISFDPATGVYQLRSHAMGNAGSFVLTPMPDGFSWDIPAGPMILRYSTTIKNGEWREVGDRIMPGKDPVRFFEMTLKRIGDTDWPAAGAIGMK